MIYMLRQEKKYFHWQIKYFIKFFLLFFPLGTALRIYSPLEQQVSYNIMYFHVSLAWASVYLYFYITYKYIVYGELLKPQVYSGIWYALYSLLSGYVWGYLVFGKLIFIDIKIFTYFLLFVTLNAIYRTLDTFYPTLFLVAGVCFYLESRFSVTYLNTFHQNFLMNYDFFFNFDTR